MQPSTDQVRLRGLIAILVGVLALWTFHLVGERLFNGYELDLGSRFEPRRVHMYFLAMWMFFGTIASVSITAGLLLGAGGLLERAKRVARGGRDGHWLVAGVLLGLCTPLLIRWLVLEGAPVTDDEGVYRFISELIAQGRLTAESPPDKLFFDRQFMINDGRYYGLYFVGWPALRAPFALLEAGGLANPFFAALTVPPLFLLVRRFAGPVAARASLVIYVTSPMLMMAAATDLSHTSCMALLAWNGYFAVTSRDDPRPWRHAAVAVSFSIAFFVRPISAVAVGLPFLVYWAWGVYRLESGIRWRAIAAMVVPSGLFGAAFLAVNWIQNGSPLVTGYAASIRYTIENQFRFTTWNLAEIKGEVGWHGTEFVMSNLGFALFRLSGAAFGWPISLILIPLAIGSRGASVFWASVLCFFATHLVAHSVGVDAFGPAHYVEVVFPILILTAMAVGSDSYVCRRVARDSELARLRQLPATAALVMVTIGFLLYTPTRLSALAAMVRPLNQIEEVVDASQLERAVIFAPFPITPACARHPTNNNVYWWLPNSPDFDDDVLWANHVDLEADRQMLARRPGRRGFLLLWTPRCEPELVPIEALDPADVPANPLAKPRFSGALER